jgi:hypothetical protein
VAAQLRSPWLIDAGWLYVLAVGMPLALLGAALPLRLPPGLGRSAPLAALGMLALGLWPRPTAEGTRLLIVGIDAATWDVADPLGDALPQLQALQREGARAELVAEEPLFSPLLWTTLATGAPPSEHGVRGFEVQATDCDLPRYWDVMEAEGISTSTYKWLVTWPPTRLSGFQVPAWLAPAPDTWPQEARWIKELELSRRTARKRIEASRSLPALIWAGTGQGLRLSTLLRALRYQILAALQPDPERDFIEGQLLRVWMDRDLAMALMASRPAEVVSFTTYAPDAIGHRAWRYREPARYPDLPPDKVRRFGGAVDRAYIQADRVLGELRAHVHPEARVVVISDHGQQAIEGGGHSLAPRTERLQARIRAEVGPVEVSRLGHKLVLHLGEGLPREALQAWLADLRLAESGEALYRLEEVPGQPEQLGLALRAEHLSLEMLEGGRLGEEPLRLYLSTGQDYSGDHHARGIFLAAGPGLARGRLEPMSQLDLMPTLLAMVGVAPAQDLRGRWPAGLFEREPELGPGPPTRRELATRRPLLDVEEQDGVPIEALEALGYVER